MFHFSKENFGLTTIVSGTVNYEDDDRPFSIEKTMVAGSANHIKRECTSKRIAIHNFDLIFGQLKSEKPHLTLESNILLSWDAANPERILLLTEPNMNSLQEKM